MVCLHLKRGIGVRLEHHFPGAGELISGGRATDKRDSHRTSVGVTGTYLKRPLARGSSLLIQTVIPPPPLI